MLRKCLFFMLLFIVIVHFSLGEEIDHYKEMQSQKNQKASAAAKAKDFYITPRIGFSTLTGQIGIELQYKHFAFDIGFLMAGDFSPAGRFFYILSYGIKYYFKPHRSTLYIGLGSGIGLNKGLDPQDIGKSFIIGYRWRWGKGWDFSLGLGAGISRKTDMGVTEGELALGYSF